MKQITYSEWLELNGDLKEQLEKEAPDRERCFECLGDGEHECSCGNIHECPECDGTGFSDSYEGVEDQLKSIYKTRLEMDLAKLAKWQGFNQ